VLIDCPPSSGCSPVNGLAGRHRGGGPHPVRVLRPRGRRPAPAQRQPRAAQPQPDARGERRRPRHVRRPDEAVEQVVLEVRKHFGDTVCRPIVPRTVRLSEAPSFGQPIIAFDPSSRGRSPTGAGQGDQWWHAAAAR
jgi:chromosome partitioning protein